MADDRQIQMDAPIPGMGMTAPLGGRPWQQPPQMGTVEEAMEYYIKKLEDPDFVPELLTVIELGVPLTTLANTMQLASVMEGKHSVDVGMLVIPILVELMSNSAYNNLWNYYNDVMEMSWESSENERQRIVQMAIAQLQSETSKELTEMKADYDSAVGFGSLIGTFLTAGTDSILGSFF